MSGVTFDKKSAKRIAAATKRIEGTPHGSSAARRDALSGTQVVFFILDEDLAAATDSLNAAATAEATVYSSDPDNPPVMAADRSTYTAQELVTSSPARSEWVTNRSLDMSGDAGAAGLAIRVNGELLIFWVDCTAGA